MTQVRDDRIGALIESFSWFRRLNSEINAELKPLGLSPDGWLTLFLLEQSSDQTPTRLAETLSLNLPTMTKLLDRLVADNLVHRKPHPTDRRVVMILLTPDGEDLSRTATDQMGNFLAARGDL